MFKFNRTTNMKKKGLSQIDWAFSLALFLLYLTWFFIIIRPAFESSQNDLEFPKIIKENFVNEVSLTMNKIPLIIKTDIKRENQPMILGFDENTSMNYAISGHYSVFDDKRLLFMDDLSRGSNLFSLLESSENQIYLSTQNDLKSSSVSASTKNFAASFESGLLKSVYYFDMKKIKSFSMLIGGSDPAIKEYHFTPYNIVAKYKALTPKLNHTTYVFAENSNIYCFIEPKEEISLNLNLEMDRYDNFFSSKDDSGEISQSSEECHSFKSDFIDFYDDDGKGVAFSFSKDVNISFCSELYLNIGFSFKTDDEASYKIMFHNESYSEIHEFLESYSLIAGVSEEVYGLSLNKIRKLDNKTYSELKELLECPEKRNFNITILNSTSNNASALFSKGEKSNEFVNIYSVKENEMMMDQHGNEKIVVLNVLSW